MDLFNNDFKHALARLANNQDFKLILAYLRDESFSKSAFTPNDPQETAYRLGKQDFIRELIERLSETDQQQVSTLVEKYK